VPIKKKAKLGKTGAPLSVAERIHLIQDCAGLGATPRYLLLTLGVLHNEEEGYAWASIEYLAHRLGLDKSSVKRVLSVLVNEEGLVIRSLRKGDWAISRKTEILWHKLHARRVMFEPKSEGPKGRVPKETATLEDDITAADTLDEAAPAAPVAAAHRNDLDVVNEAMALLRSHFSGHSTFSDKNADKIIYGCIWECFEKVESAEYGLAVLQWVCTNPANENMRGHIHKSGKLGGYIKSCFGGWSREFEVADQASYPAYEQCLTAVCGGGTLFFSTEDRAFLQPFRTWLSTRLGEHLLALEVKTQDEDVYVRVDVTEEFKAGRLLEFPISEQPNS
jgi:hypothetical protein